MPVNLAKAGQRVVGVDVGGTKIRAALVDHAGNLDAEIERPTPASGGEALLSEISELIVATATVGRSAGLDVVASGIGTAGVIANGVIVSANELIPQWTGTDLAGRLRASCGIPITVLNDVHASATAEARLGAGVGYRTALVVSVGTGIGGAFVIDGSVMGGARGVGGSVGHVPAPTGAAPMGATPRRCACGALDHVEAYSGGRSLESIYRESRGRSRSLLEIAHDARAGDTEAELLIGTSAHLLGRAIGGAVNILDPDVVIIGGGVAQIGAGYLADLREGVRLEAMAAQVAPPVVPAHFGTRSALAGAGVSAFLQFEATAAGAGAA
jgi:glucokinase